MVTRSPPASSASLAPLANGRMASWSPWITRTGHRTRVASSAARSGSENGSPWALDPSRVAISVSGSVSSPQPTVSSIGLVECGSVNICEKKNSRNSR
jgi:hypothetical protein